MLSRRSFLRATVVTLGAAFAPGCGDDTSNTASNRDLVEGKAYFPQSVASGDPRPASVVVWTRVVDGERAGWDLDIELEVALDAAFTQRVGEPIKLQALAHYDNCVKARIVGDPGKTYYYRFIYERDGTAYVSRVGRTRTAPAEDADVPVRFAFVSCQDFVGRYYNTLLALAAEDLDFVVHLGDYVYETTGDPSFQTPDDARKVVFGDTAGAIELGANGDEKFYAAKSLDNYRDLYRTYRSDPALQAVHEKFPMIPTWDDHEFSNDCWGANANYLSGQVAELDVARRKAANQAWFEYQPVDYADAPDFKYDAAVDYPNDIRIYRDFTFGKHVHLVVTDLRSYRPDHLIPEDAFPGAVLYDEATLTASPGGLPGAAVATAYINIDDAAYAVYKGILAQAATSAGYDPTRITGNVSVDYINAVVGQINTSPTPPDPLIPLLDGSGQPRGVSYFDLNKVSFFAQIGTRYFVHKDAFDVVSTLRYAEDPKTQNVMGDAQEAWFLETLTASKSTWKVWANEFNIVPVQVDLRQIVGIPANVQRRFYMGVEGWDGFRDKRNELLEKIGGLGNVVALTGDLHTFMAGTPWAEQDPTKKIVEFMTGAVSSTPWRDELSSQVKADPVLSQIPAAPLLALQIDDLVLDVETKVNPHLAHAESNTHGYAVAEVSGAEVVVTMHSISGKEVTTSYAGKTADFVGKMQKTRFKTVAGGSDLFKEIDGGWKKWDTATLVWV